MLDADAIVPPVEVSIRVMDERGVPDPEVTVIVIVINVLKVNVFPVPRL